MSRQCRRCRECPKRDENGVCVVHAQWVSAFHPSCPYGRRMMNNAASAEYQRRKHGYKPRKQKPVEQQEEE